jgi:putative oxidoreductase
MPTNANIAERVAFGRPLETYEDTQVHVAPRPKTALVGRILLATIFLVSGFAKLTNTGETAAHMSGVGIPMAETLALVAGAAEILGALAIGFGFLTRPGAIGLILFMIPTTLLFHNFWAFEGAEQKTQMISFLKNLTIIGGLSLLIAHGPGAYSIDQKLRKRIAV